MTIQIVNANPFGLLSPDRLAEFESKYQLHLPGDYRSFLLQYNGGRPSPSFFWIKPKEDGSNVDRFYGLYDKLSPSSIETYMESERCGIPKAMMPIGDDGTGNFIAMGVRPQNLGNIFFLDHEIHPFRDPEALEGITRLAGGFSDFLATLEENPEA